MLGHIIVIERGPICQTNAEYIRRKNSTWIRRMAFHQNQKIYKTVQNGMKFRSWDICWPLFNTDGKTKMRTYMYLKVGPLLILGGYVGVSLFNDQIDSTAF